MHKRYDKVDTRLKKDTEYVRLFRIIVHICIDKKNDHWTDKA